MVASCTGAFAQKFSPAVLREMVASCTGAFAQKFSPAAMRGMVASCTGAFAQKFSPAAIIRCGGCFYGDGNEKADERGMGEEWAKDGRKMGKEWAKDDSGVKRYFANQKALYVVAY